MNQNYYLRRFEQVMSPNLCRGSPTIGQDHKDGWNSMVCIYLYTYVIRKKFKK